MNKTFAVISVFAGVISFPIIWFLMVKSLKRNGWPSFLAHIFGAVCATVGGLASVSAIASVQVVPIAITGLIFGLFYLLATRIRVSEPKPRPKRSDRAIIQSNGAAPAQLQAQAQADTEREAKIEAIRKASLQAMKRATTARNNDMKRRGEPIAQPLYIAPNEPYVHCFGPIAEIQFRYIDSRGSSSKRRVSVEAIDDEYFEGFCHKRKAQRTFVIGRVRGKVLNIDTGELLPPRDWADEVRRHPSNDGIILNRSR